MIRETGDQICESEADEVFGLKNLVKFTKYINSRYFTSKLTTKKLDKSMKIIISNNEPAYNVQVN